MTTQTETQAYTTHRGSRMGMARSRGGFSGLLLMLLGVWGAIIPFVGHYFGYGFTPNNEWHWTAARFWLEVLPGVVTLAAGFIISTSANRVSASFAGWVGAAAGAWFVVGSTFSPLWSAGFIGTPDGGANLGVAERIGMFDGLGLVIILFAALAVGRFSVVGQRDLDAVETRRVTRSRRSSQPVAAETTQPYPANGEAATTAPTTTAAPTATTTTAPAEPTTTAAPATTEPTTSQPI